MFPPLNFTVSFRFPDVASFTRILSFIDECATLSLSVSKDLMFLVDHKTISIILPLVKLSILSINHLTACSMLGQ